SHGADGVLVRAPSGQVASDDDVHVDGPVCIDDARSQLNHRCVDEYRTRLRVVDDIADLVGGEMGVHGAVVEPGKLAAPRDFQELRTVRQHQCDPVAAPQPGRVKKRGDALAPGVQRAVGDGVAAHDYQGR